MGRLTKAGFARAKSELGLKGKLTRKQVQRVFKKAIKKLGRTQRRVSKKGRVYYTKPKKRRKSNPKRRVRRTARRRKRRRGGKSLQRTIFKWMRIGALVAPQAYNMTKYPGDWKRNLGDFLYDYTGYNPADGTWDIGRLAKGWGPFLAACLATYGIPKITGILRRI